MPIEIPTLDNRRYQELLDEALARIPVHTPEWTNFNQSDPGVTLIQVFAFLTESLLYRANQIPERNRRKFLQLLGVPLTAASSAQGIVTITNERGPLQTITLNRDLEVRAGQVPFRTTRGLDVLPIEAKVFLKRTLPNPPAEQVQLYRELYASFLNENPTATPELYELVPLETRGREGTDVGNETVDGSLWIALLARPNETPDMARRVIAGKTLNLGLVPRLDLPGSELRLPPGGRADNSAGSLIQFQLPSIPASGGLPANRQPDYRTLRSERLPLEPAVFEIPLPEESQLTLWNNLDPLESGADDLPPPLEDTALNDRLITWLRVKWPEGVRAHLVWAGINATPAGQRARVANELLPPSTGEPDQTFALSRQPVIPDSLRLTVTPRVGASETWQPIDDLLAAGAEVPSDDPRLPPGVPQPKPRPSQVFVLDAEAGRIAVGDGFHGARPPAGATLRVDYDFSEGREGNVGAGAISNGPALPAGLKVTNPVRTWGGADAESVAAGEKHVSRFLQHRDRLVTATDFETIALRTPGVNLGRVDVLAAYNPALARNEPGNAPGAVTLMLIPKFSPTRPDAPSPDRVFLQTVCEYLDPRRLVTTELFLRGPDYKSIWVSAGIEVVAGYESAVVREDVKKRLMEFLAPLRTGSVGQLDDQNSLLTTPRAAESNKGWPLRRAVLSRELEAEVARVPGVALVNSLLLAGDTGGALERIEMKGLQLPRVDGISVTAGDPQPLAELRGDIRDAGGLGAGSRQPPKRVPVPFVPKEC